MSSRGVDVCINTKDRPRSLILHSYNIARNYYLFAILFKETNIKPSPVDPLEDYNFPINICALYFK